MKNKHLQRWIISLTEHLSQNILSILLAFFSFETCLKPYIYTALAAQGLILLVIFQLTRGIAPMLALCLYTVCDVDPTSSERCLVSGLISQLFLDHTHIPQNQKTVTVYFNARRYRLLTYQRIIVICSGMPCMVTSKGGIARQTEINAML